MASPQLTEDERRLLREYRLTRIPLRRQNSCPVKPQAPREKKQQQELSFDELNQILGLVSELNYIKLVPTIDENKPNQTSKEAEAPNPIASTTTATTNVKNPISTPTPTTANNLATTDKIPQAQNKIAAEPYIFNKVDYLQRLSIRKKAIKKLKKAKIKSQKHRTTPTQNLRNLEA